MAIELLTPKPMIIVPKPKSYVKLDMAFGIGAGTTLFDKSRYRSHGAITGASWATGAHGKCLDFDPTVPSYVGIPAAHTQLNFTSQAFSIIARINVDSVAGINTIFSRGGDTVDGYLFTIDSMGRLYVWTSQTSARQNSYSNTGVVSAGQWCTVGMSRVGSLVRVFNEGIDMTITSTTHIDPQSCARTAKIGILDDLVTSPFDGKMEFLRIFGGIALSASEHLAWHNALK